MEETVSTKVQGNVPSAEPAHVTDDIKPVSNYFNVQNPDPDQAMKMATIAKYLRGNSQEYNEISALRDIRDLMFKLGTPPLGSSVLDHAYNYAKIAARVKDDTKELERYMR